MSYLNRKLESSFNQIRIDKNLTALIGTKGSPTLCPFLSWFPPASPSQHFLNDSIKKWQNSNSNYFRALATFESKDLLLASGWSQIHCQFTVTIVAPSNSACSYVFVSKYKYKYKYKYKHEIKTKKYTRKLVHPCHYCHQQWLHLEPSRDRRPQAQLQHLYQTTITTTFPDLFHLQKHQIQQHIKRKHVFPYHHNLVAT